MNAQIVATSVYYEKKHNEVASQDMRAELQIDPDYAVTNAFLHAINLVAIQHKSSWFSYKQNRFLVTQFHLERARQVRQNNQSHCFLHDTCCTSRLSPT
jgi:hypothetical protein